MKSKPIKSYITIGLLVFLLFAPVSGVWILSKFKHYLSAVYLGQLKESFFLNPITPMVSLPIKTLQGDTLDTTQLRGKWILLYFNSHDCTKKRLCFIHMTNMSSIANALKSDRHRLIQLWLTTIPIPKEIPQQADITFSQLDKNSNLESNQYYLVDPFGNMIMRYKNTTPPEKIIKDLQHLMRRSQIG